jgi:hypothetical protein
MQRKITKLDFETWDIVFNSSGTGCKFNCFLNACCFLNTYLRISYSSFPLPRIKNSTRSKTFITLGMETSCKPKRELYLAGRNCND